LLSSRPWRERCVGDGGGEGGGEEGVVFYVELAYSLLDPRSWRHRCVGAGGGDGGGEEGVVFYGIGLLSPRPSPKINRTQQPLLCRTVRCHAADAAAADVVH
jgi:hypothetical protein